MQQSEHSVVPSPPLSHGAPFFLAGFDPRQIRPRLPAPWQARSAPAQAGAAGLLASGLGRAPCLRACALRQSDRENAPPERFQAVLRGRSCGAWPGPLPDGGSHWAKGFWTGIRLGDQAAPAQAGAAGLSASCLGMAPCLRACALRQSDRENAPPERFQAVLRGRWSGRGAGSGCLPEGESRRARGAGLGTRLVNPTAPAQAGAAGLLPSGVLRAPCLRACALRQPDRENASPERFQAVLRGRFSGACRGVFAGERSSGTSCGLANRRTPAGPIA